MDQQGWKEVTISNSLDSYIHKKIRTCYGCKYLKHSLVKSGRNPIYNYMCEAEINTDKQHNLSVNGRPSIMFNVLHENIHGYVEPLEKCPFTQQIERDLKINNIIDDKN